MKIEVNEQSDIVLKEVYNGIILETNSGESIGICMRDSGFEFNYMGVWYEAKEGKVSAGGGDIVLESRPNKEDFIKGVGQRECQEALNKYYTALENFVDVRYGKVPVASTTMRVKLEVKVIETSGEFDSKKLIGAILFTPVGKAPFPCWNIEVKSWVSLPETDMHEVVVQFETNVKDTDLSGAVVQFASGGMEFCKAVVVGCTNMVGLTFSPATKESFKGDKKTKFELDEVGQMHTPEMICSREGCTNAATQFGLCPDHFEEL